MKKTLLFASMFAVLALSACGGTPDVPQDIVDNNMTITRLNAQKNANSYIAEVYRDGAIDKKFGEAPMRALVQSDSSVSKTCRYGDGWASGNIQFPSGGTIKIKCQTNGVGKGINGCMTEAEFQDKSYKNEENTCQPSITSLEKFK